MAGNRIIEFKEEGVIFTFSPDLDHVFVERLDIERIKGDGSYNPNRYVLQVLMFTKEEIDTDIREFCKKFKLLVKFTEEDISNAQNTDENLVFPVLGIFDGKKWHTPEGEKINYEKYPSPVNRWVGFAELELDRWDDPLMGWGP